MKFHENPSSGSRVFPTRTETQTGLAGMTKLTAALLSFGKAHTEQSVTLENNDC